MLFPLFQDALLSLGAAIDIAGLRQAAKEALSAVLPRVVGVCPSRFLPALPSLCSGSELHLTLPRLSLGFGCMCG